MHRKAPAGSPLERCTGRLGPFYLSVIPHSHAGLLSAAERAEWQAHNPSPLIRAFRQLSSVSGWLSRGVAALAETPLGGRILYDAVVKSAAGEPRSP